LLLLKAHHAIIFKNITLVYCHANFKNPSRLQESKRADRSTTKMSLSTSRLKTSVTCSPTIPTYGKKTQVMNTAHSAISYFITGLSPTCMFACA